MELLTKLKVNIRLNQWLKSKEYNSVKQELNIRFKMFKYKKIKKEEEIYVNNTKIKQKVKRQLNVKKG